MSVISTGFDKNPMHILSRDFG